MPTTANSITYFVAADGTLRDGSQGSIAQQPRINYGTEYSVTLSFPPSTIAEGDQLQVALNRTRTFFSSASATGDAPVAAVAKHDVTAEEAAAQEVAVVLSTNTRAMIDQVNGIDHPVRGFFGVHVLRGQSFVTFAVADALMMSLESGPDAISPSLPVVDYPTRDEAVALAERSEAAAGRAETAQGKAEEAQGKAETAEDNAQIWAEGTDQQVEELGGEHSAKEYNRLAGVSATNAEQSATNAGQFATDAGNAKTAAETAQGKAEEAQGNAEKIAEGSDADVEPLGLEHSAKGWAQEAAATLASKRDILQPLVTSSSTSLEVEAGKSYNWTVSAASTIALAAADKVANKETRIDIYIDLQSGGSVAGSGVIVSDAVLQSGWYKLIWDGTTATLYSTKAGGAESVITIPAATTSYSLQDNKHYQQVPSAVPTYTLPTATMDGLVHEITVLVDFMHVTSCSFVDAGGVPVTLQSAISPQIGEAYVFRCYWYGKWRVVPLKIRNAATATSSNGVVQVSDAVAGNALALKMVAPRSVVVNQLVQNGNFANTDGWSTASYGTLSASNNVCTLTLTNTNTSGRIQCSINIVSGHTYILLATVKSPKATTFLFGHSGKVDMWGSLSVEQNTTRVYSSVATATNTGNILYLYCNRNSSLQIGDTVEYSKVMVVDLTQYFNGDTTLIDSITNWDDLVAYDPRFAQYVEYNTGTVEGVQPTVKVTGKNLAQYNSTAFNYDSTNRVKDFSLGLTESVVRQLSNKPITLSYGNADTNLVLSFFVIGVFSDTSNNYKSFSYTPKGGSSVSGTLNLDTMVVFRSASMRLYNVDNATGSITPTNVQLELGSSATSYEPYHDGGTAQAPAPLFAVGNAADEFEAVAGVTTRKMGSYTFTGNETWTAYNNSTGCSWYLAINDKQVGYSNIIIPEYRTMPNVTSMTENDKTIVGNNNSRTIYIHDSAYPNTDVNAFKAYMAGKTIYYELETPTTSQSTPTQISLQAGDNTAMQTDGGRTLEELSMTYENLPANE